MKWNSFTSIAEEIEGYSFLRIYKHCFSQKKCKELLDRKECKPHYI